VHGKVGGGSRHREHHRAVAKRHHHALGAGDKAIGIVEHGELQGVDEAIEGQQAGGIGCVEARKRRQERR
jgi:hypothetical protein